MKPDLLPAQAAVDWVVDNLPFLNKRLTDWSERSFLLSVKKLPPPSERDLIVATATEPLPLEFNAEVGAYVNSLRSSLDMLAFSLFERGCKCSEKDVYFPIAENEAKFKAGKYNGATFVAALTQDDRDLIESLKPYAGGNDKLWALHRLDIRRKHHRLLSVVPQPFSISVKIDPFSMVWPLGGDGYIENGDEIVLAQISKGAPLPTMKFEAQVVLDEEELLPRQAPGIALHEFAGFATSVIAMFA